MEWKAKLIEKIQFQQKQESPIKVSASEIADEKNRKKLDYLKIILNGQFDHSREVYIAPRHKLDPETGGLDRDGGSLHSNSAGRTSAPVGANVVTPFKIKGSDRIVLVNRGWVPFDDFLQRQKIRGKSPDCDRKETQVVGILRNRGDPGSGEMSKGEKGKFNSKNFHFICSKVAEEGNGNEVVTPVCIDEIVNSPSKDLSIETTPFGGQSQLEIPNNHMGYVIQWAGLCIASAWLTRKLYFPKNSSNILRK